MPIQNSPPKKAEILPPHYNNVSWGKDINQEEGGGDINFKFNIHPWGNIQYILSFFNLVYTAEDTRVGISLTFSRNIIYYI